MKINGDMLFPSIELIPLKKSEIAFSTQPLIVIYYLNNNLNIYKQA